MVMDRNWNVMLMAVARAVPMPSAPAFCSLPAAPGKLESVPDMEICCTCPTHTAPVLDPGGNGRMMKLSNTREHP